jgi:hypothetical protein
MYLSYRGETPNGTCTSVYIHIYRYISTHTHTVITYGYRLRMSAKAVNIWDTCMMYTYVHNVHMRHMYNVHFAIYMYKRTYSYDRWTKSKHVGNYVRNVGKRLHVHFATYTIYEYNSISFPYIRSPINDFVDREEKHFF